MSRNKGFSRLTKFLQPPKLVDGIFEVLFRLQKFWWVQKVVRTRNGFALTDFFAKQAKFCVVRTGPKIVLQPFATKTTGEHLRLVRLQFSYKLRLFP